MNAGFPPAWTGPDAVRTSRRRKRRPGYAGRRRRAMRRTPRWTPITGGNTATDMKAVRDFNWAALKRDRAAISDLRRQGLTNREDNALSRLARLKRKISTPRPPFHSPRKPTNSAARPAPDSSSRTSSATTHRSRSRTGSRMPASPNTSPSTASVIPSPPSRSTKAPTYTPSPTCSPTPTSERRRFTPTSWTRARETQLNALR